MHQPPLLVEQLLRMEARMLVEAEDVQKLDDMVSMWVGWSMGFIFRGCLCVFCLAACSPGVEVKCGGSKMGRSPPISSKG